jgi:Flp pilus assembly protein TadD, contains TPR repeats
MMKSFISLVAVVMLGSSAVTAQSVAQGKKFLYYQRYKSAKETLEKVVAANPNDIEATYWLGQVLIKTKDSVAAKNLYSKLLQQNGNAPLVLAGMGQIELMEGKTADARQRFESAISITKARDIDVFNAVARANIDAKLGDANYAIEKLNQATQVKKFNDATTYMLMGDAYRKLVDGGNAVLNYEKAFSMDNTLAAAKWSIGKIYLTQQNYTFFVKYLDDALIADPNFAPAYYDLHVYYFDKDVNKSRENFLKYKDVADQDPELEYLETSLYYASRQYQQAIDMSKQKIQQLGDKADPRYYKLTAYSYAEGLNDTANAKTYMDQYFAKQSTEDFVPKDYSFYAQLLAKTPGSETQAFAQYEKAIELDTARTGKLQLLEEAGKLATSIGDKELAAVWNSKRYYFDTASATNRDLYDYGYAHYAAGNYDSAYNVFKNIYQVKYPNEIYGYLWAARSAQFIDSTWENGLAASETQLYAEKSKEIDSVKFKAQIILSYKQLAQYYNNVKKDRDSAIVYLEKVIQIDPEDKDAPRFLDILRKSAKPAQRTGGSSGATTKPNGSSSGKK